MKNFLRAIVVLGITSLGACGVTLYGPPGSPAFNAATHFDSYGSPQYLSQDDTPLEKPPGWAMEKPCHTKCRNGKQKTDNSHFKYWVATSIKAFPTKYGAEASAASILEKRIKTEILAEVIREDSEEANNGSSEEFVGKIWSR